MNAPGRVIQAIVCHTAGAPGPGGNAIDRELRGEGTELRAGGTAHAPDVLHRPAARPVEIDRVAVAALRVARRAWLEQGLDHEAVCDEQVDPLSVAELEVDRFTRLLAAVQLP